MHNIIIASPAEGRQKEIKMENSEKKIGLTAPAATSAKEKNRKYITTIVGVGLMTAIIVVLQLLASAIRFGPFSITLTLAPIIIGAAVFGQWAGAWLGFVFGAAVLLSGDAAAFMTVDAVGTVLTVLVKGTLSGFLAGLVYNLIEKKNKYAAVIAAGITAPVVNTGVFLIGCFVFFLDTISQWAAGEGLPVGEYILVGFIGLNFPVELMINLALSTVIVTVIGFARKTLAERR